ncbi:methylisocitrate lyase [Singulisphaera acidiphila]|uniref:2-methylisocitrate lyase n=1 Tax=Singulisphaera acidiphila (strain ATCC BAA-1392 / DSM 18658 / VKM B-2454 / MOB10) TaxID=886293 RepID=L0DCK4_SINAD|nr:methylisocitrate lyase [Singulisphaera acidiphila]AGA26573.1 methylisocitrate lyase [Singulisphaera acidiphila DSM 18658]
MPSPGARLRAAWVEQPIAIPGAFNALTAKLAERLGFAAVYLSGGALSAGWAGLPDIGLLSLTEFVEQAAVIARATSLPLLCDADTGFGEAINVVRTIQLFEQAGVAGVHLEDQVLPKRCGHLSGKALVETSAMTAKIRAAVEARRDPDFVIIARTDARSVEGFDAAIDRARAYRAAGADMIFPEALESPEEFAQFAERVEGPKIANMTEFGRSPLLTLDELGGLGYQAALFPLTAFRAAMRAVELTLVELRNAGTQRGIVDQMQTRAELYELLGYTNWEQRDRAYFTETPTES